VEGNGRGALPERSVSPGPVAPRLLTPLQAAVYLGFKSAWPVRELMWKGQLPVVRIGKRRIAFDIADLDRFIEANKTCELIDRGPTKSGPGFRSPTSF
jgi:hypothetical protein